MNEMEKFQKYLQAEDLSSLTVIGYLTDVRLFMTWFEKHNCETFALERVTPIDVREYREYLQKERGLKASSVNRKLASIASLMKWAKQTHQISVDPTENVKPVRQTVLAPHWLDKKEQFALQRALEKDLQVSKLRYPKRWITRRRDASLVQFMLHTGLRLSEILALEIRDLEISERKGNVLVRHGKGNKERTVPLNAEARKAVQDWLAVRPDVNSNFLWVAVEGPAEESLSGREVQRVLKRYAQDSGLDELTPHMLRHSFAKNLANRGVGLEKIAVLLGHSSLNTTRIYITPDTKDLELAVEQLEQ
jgi:integrase/recombinase XerC